MSFQGLAGDVSTSDKHATRESTWVGRCRFLFLLVSCDLQGLLLYDFYLSKLQIGPFQRPETGRVA